MLAGDLNCACLDVPAQGMHKPPIIPRDRTSSAAVLDALDRG
jgi:hypothetical protein